MLEIIMIIGISITMGRMASMENQSGALWGFITLVTCMASLTIPLPFLRIIIAGAGVFVGMIIYNISDKKKR